MNGVMLMVHETFLSWGFSKNWHIIYNISGDSFTRNIGCSVSRIHTSADVLPQVLSSGIYPLR